LEISNQEKNILKLFAQKIDPDDPGAHNNLAIVYYNKSLIKDAVEELKRALEIEPHFTLAKNNLDYIYRTTGYYDEDVERLKKEVEKAPNGAEARLKLARAYKSTGDYYDALKHYNKYLRHNPADKDALIEMGISCKSIGFYEPAIEAFKKAIRIRGDLSSAHKYLGEVYYNLGVFPHAINELKKAIKLDPKDAETYYLLSFAYGEEGRFDKAKEAANKAVQLNPRYGKTEPNLGLGIYRQKGYEDFLSISKSMVKDQPFFGYYVMGLTYKNKGMFEEALRELRRAKEVDPGNPLIKEQIGEVLLFLGKNEDAISVYSEALKDDPDSPKVANNLGIACHRLGRLTEAVSWYERAISKDRNYAVSWNNLGVVSYHSRNPGKAFECFKKANKLNPDYPDPYLNIGLIHMSRGDFDKAERLFKKVIQIKEEYPLPYNYLGSVYLSTERFESAIHQFQQAVDRDDGFAEAYYNLGFAFSRIGKYDRALEATKKAMEINPFYTSNRFKLGLDIYSDRLDLLVARELTEEMEMGGVVGEEAGEEEIFENLFGAIENEILVFDVEESIEKAEHLFAENKLDEALKVLNEVRQHEPENSRVLILLGKIYRDKGLLGEVKDVLFALIPDNEEAVRILASVYVQNGEWGQANAMAKILRDRNVKDPFPYFVSARYSKHKKEYGKAIRILKGFPDWKNNADILREIGSLYLPLRNRVKALAYIKRSLSISPSGDAYLLLAKLKIRKRNFKEAESNLLKARKLDPRNKDALKLLIKTRLKLKDYKGAIKAANDSKGVIKADSDIALWVGKAYCMAGKIGKAVESLKQAISFNGENIKAYDSLASIYFRAGKYKKAENLWETIIKKAGDSEVSLQASEALESLLRLRKLTGEI